MKQMKRRDFKGEDVKRERQEENLTKNMSFRCKKTEELVDRQKWKSSFEKLSAER